MLTTCPVCAHKVSEDARACPNCGHDVGGQARNQRNTIIALAVVVLIVVVSFIVNMLNAQTRQIIGTP